MKVRMMRDARPFGRTGDIVEVSPAGFDYVTSLGIAVPVTEARERAEAPKAEKPAEKTAAKKTTKSSAKK